MVVPDLDIFERGDSVVDENRRRAIQRNQVVSDALLLIPMKRTERPGVCSPGRPG
jgi:hypothetical protein